MPKCLILALTILAAFTPQEEKAWQEAYAKLSKLANEKDMELKAGAIKDLGDATYEKRDPELVQIVLGQLLGELKDDTPQGNKEEKIDGRILDACEYALAKIKSKKAIDMLIAQARNKGGSPRVKFYLCRALGGVKAEQALIVKTLLELAQDDKADPKVEIGANDGLAMQKDRSTIPHFIKLLGSDGKIWEVKIVAAKALRTLLKKEKADALPNPEELGHAEQLIEVLSKLKPIETRIKVELIELLGELLNVSDAKTEDANWWKSALAEAKRGQKPGTSGGTTVEPVEFFGLKTKSSRIVFVLDRTGSMDFPCSEANLPKKDPPKKPEQATGDKPDPASEAARQKAEEIKKKYDNRKIEKRMDALKREFINTIYNLDERVMFNVVWYEGNSQPWKPEFVKATWPVKMECIKDVDSINPSGGTNIWGALEHAYQFVAQPSKPDVIQDKKGNYATVVNGPDTIFLMTDGNHNNGRFAIPTPPFGDFDENAFFAEFKKINALRKVVVNTIILGDTTGQQDPIKPKSISLFKRIAEESNGSFAHIGK